jgi:hypothetical protein
MTERYSHLGPEHLKGASDFLSLGVESNGNIVRLLENGGQILDEEKRNLS